MILAFDKWFDSVADDVSSDKYKENNPWNCDW